MARKINVKLILELRKAGLSRNMIAATRHMSKNSVGDVIHISDERGITYDDVSALDEDAVYRMFYPDKHATENLYRQPDYEYVHKELKHVGVTLKLLWQEYQEKCKAEGKLPMGYTKFCNGYSGFTVVNKLTSHLEHKPGAVAEVDWSGPTMSYVDTYSQYSYVEPCLDMKMDSFIRCHVRMYGYFGGVATRLVCDNLKTGVVSHPREGEIVLTTDYEALGEYYRTAIMPAGVRKPKQKPSVEGSVGKIARKIIGMLRHETFYSLEALNCGIRDALIKLNSKEFQKRNGSRKILFETEEKPMLRALPLIPFEICEWSYNHKVGPNSHIWFGKGQYSVPIDYLNQYVDVRYNNAMVYIYSSHKLIAEHKRLPSGLKNGKRTEASYLPYPLYTPETVESTTAKAEEIGANTTTVVCRIYENAKIKEQALMDVRSVLDIANIYGEKTLEEACRRALKDFHMITYNTLIPYIKDISKNKKNKIKSENGKEHKHGIVRGADYYRKDGTK